MPELPEVETARRGLRPHLLGQTVTRVLVREARLRWPVPDQLGQRLTGSRIESLERRSKYLLFGTGQGRLMLHLGMSGSLRLLPVAKPLLKHDHVVLEFGNQSLRFNDPRRFGSLHWLEGRESHKLLDSLGPEPLGDAFDGAYLFAHSRRRQVAVKQFIMNAQVVVGVGNIYANEALYLAGIRPTKPAGALSKTRCQRLATSIVQVLGQAIEAGGTSFRDFVKEDGSPGYFAQSLAVYGRAGQACKKCRHPLKEVRLSNRSTVFCPTCQR